MDLDNVEKNYEINTEKVVALQNFSYFFKKGTFYAIIGHSGSGKSTLIRILGLIDKMSSGNYLLNGVNIADLNDFELSRLRMSEIGFVFQDFYLDEYLKAYENVMLPMLINKKIKKEERKEKAIKLLDELGLKNRINHYPKEMSGGEQQRVAIARSLANDPEYILADEPTGNLDEKNEKNVFEILKEMSKSGKCVIVVSHSKIVDLYADVLLQLKDGKLVLK